jgi:hypothetical protein
MRPYASPASPSSPHVGVLDASDVSVGTKSGTTASRGQLGGPMRFSLRGMNRRVRLPLRPTSVGKCSVNG